MSSIDSGRKRWVLERQVLKWVLFKSENQIGIRTCTAIYCNFMSWLATAAAFTTLHWSEMGKLPAKAGLSVGEMEASHDIVGSLQRKSSVNVQNALTITNTSLRCFCIARTLQTAWCFFLLAAVKCQLPAVLVDKGPLVKYDIAYNHRPNSARALDSTLLFYNSTEFTGLLRIKDLNNIT